MEPSESNGSSGDAGSNGSRRLPSIGGTTSSPSAGQATPASQASQGVGDDAKTGSVKRRSLMSDAAAAPQKRQSGGSETRSAAVGRPSAGGTTSSAGDATPSQGDERSLKSGKTSSAGDSSPSQGDDRPLKADERISKGGTISSKGDSSPSQRDEKPTLGTMPRPSGRTDASDEGRPSRSTRGLSGSQRLSRRSSKASYSKTISSADAFMDVVPEELPPEKLAEAIDVLERANHLVKLENDVFEEKLHRERPDLLAGLHQLEEPAPAAGAERDSGSGSAAESGSLVTRPSGSEPGGRQAGAPVGISFGQVQTVLDSTSLSQSRSRTTGSSPSEPASSPRASVLATKAQAWSLERVPKMSLSQRMDIAEEAARLAEQRREAAREQAAVSTASRRVQIEEMNVRLQETRLALHQLEQIGMASAERFLRFMSDWIKGAEATVERLRLKTSSLRAHHRRVKADLAVKRELGEALRPVDFDKLRIEIQEMGKKLDNKNMHLNDLKNISGNATARLLAGKKKLVDLTRKLQDIHKEVASKRAQISNLEGEERKVLEDVARADIALNAIRLRMEKHTAPELLEYVQIKDELSTLRKDVVVWDRRCKIQQQTERDLRRGLRAMGTRTPQHESGRRRAGSASDTSTSSLSSARGGRRRRLRGRSRSRSRSGTRSDSARSSCPSSHSDTLVTR